MSARPKSRVTRDVKMVFDLFVETMQGGTPGQMYIFQYERGDREKGTSDPSKANDEGTVEFKFHKSFVSTLQRKNEISYKRKDFRLAVSEYPGGYVLLDLVYDLSGPVDQEVFPNKKLMIKSINGKSRLLFSLSGISEQEFLRLNSDQQQASIIRTRGDPPKSVSPSGPSLQQQQQQAQAPVASSEVNRAASFGDADDVIKRQQSSVRPQQDEEDDEFGDIVTRAVADKVSGTKTKRRVGEESVVAAVAAPQQQPPVATPAVPAPAQPRGVVVKNGDLEETPLRNPHQGSSSPAPRGNIRAEADDEARAAPVHDAPPIVRPTRVTSVVPPPPQAIPVEKSIEPTASIATTPPVASASAYTSHNDDDNVDTSTATVNGSTRVDKDVESYLAEIKASILGMGTSSSSMSRQQGNTAHAAATSTVKTYHFMSGTTTASSIPRASLLGLHCLKYWKGERRNNFLHDFIAMLFVEVIPTTRHAASWMNCVLHILYHSLSQPMDDSENVYGVLSEQTAIQVADELLECIEKAEECGFGTRNTFLVPRGRADKLMGIIPSDDALLESKLFGRSAPKRGFPMHPATTIILSVALEEALRRLGDVASENAFEDIERFCYPPKMAPTTLTVNGYQFSRSDGSKGTVMVPTSDNAYLLGGGGLGDHPTEDPAFSVVLRSLDRLYEQLHGVPVEQSATVSPLLRMVNSELFRIIFRNINNTLINHLVVQGAQPSCRVRKVREAMNLKLALSMFESWLQEHSLFTVARPELLACRQVCDLVILQKRLLRNTDVREEVTSQLHPRLVVFLLEQYQPNPKDLPADDVPQDVLEFFRNVADDRERKLLQASRSKNASSKTIQRNGDQVVPRIATKPLSTFAFLDYVSSLIPRDDEVQSDGAAGRKSMRQSLAAATRIKEEADGLMGAYSAGQSVASQRSLNWDHSADKIVAVRNQEAVLGLATTHDLSGNPLSPVEAVQTEEKIQLRLAALSIPDDDVIRAAVV